MPGDVVHHLSRDEVLEIHQRLLAAFGGPAGVRDHGLLESALFRPRTLNRARVAVVDGHV